MGRPARTGAWLEYLLAAGFLLLAWQVAAWLVRRSILPPPLEVFGLFAGGLVRGLGQHLLVSTFRAVASILISFGVAVPFGLSLGRIKALDRLVAPLVYLLYPVPKIVFLPLIMVLLGLGDGARIFLISLIVFFQILVTTRDAARAVNHHYILSVASLGATEAQVYRHVVLPAVLPEILTALRIGLGTAIAVLFIAETFATREGLGYYIIETWSRQAFSEMFAGVLAMGLLGFTLYVLLDWVERKICPWHHL